MRSISEIFKQISANLMVLSYSIENLSRIFTLLLDFVKNAPQDYFEIKSQEKKSFKEIPLFLSDKGEASLKSKLSEFPRVFETGDLHLDWRKLDKDPGQKDSHPNLLYLIGQFLSTVAMNIEYMEFSKKEVFEKHKKDVENLFKVWGNRERMNAMGLFNKYQSTNNEKALQDLEKKLSQSLPIIDNLQK